MSEELELVEVEGTFVDDADNLPKNPYVFKCPQCELTLVEGLPQNLNDDLSKPCECCGDINHRFVLITTNCTPPCEHRFNVRLKGRTIQ